MSHTRCLPRPGFRKGKERGASPPEENDGQPLLQARAQELEAVRAEVRQEEDEHRRVVEGNEELQATTARGQTEEHAARESLARLHAETEELSAAGRAAQDLEDRQERVSRLRRESVEATEELTTMRRSSEERQSELASLRSRVDRGSAQIEEWRACEQATEQARLDSRRARNALIKAETQHGELRAAVDSARSGLALKEEEVLRLTAEVSEAQVEAQNRQDSYWDDAPFLSTSADIVAQLRAAISERTEVAAEKEAALAREEQLHREALESQQQQRTGFGNLARANLSADSFDIYDKASRAVAPESSFIATPDASRIREQSLASPAHASSPPAAPAAAHATLAALEAENGRLRQRVETLRSLASRAPSGTAALALAVPDQLHCTGGFDAAVAGTGARVVGQMKQALHDDVLLMRSLHSAKKELESERRRERRMRASLQRQLDALRSPVTSASCN
mmetsp:Transcript_32733/g.60131  ORF Transcript_32733/g.60131 Transcript_32733/m.60131 type:complete len:455 (-) Transcript_32733:48-1412(-)